jgi:hypothetical protein
MASNAATAAAQLYQVVARNGTLEEARAALEECKQSLPKLGQVHAAVTHRLALCAALNRGHGGDDLPNETPLEAADRLRPGT